MDLRSALIDWDEPDEKDKRRHGPSHRIRQYNLGIGFTRD